MHILLVHQYFLGDDEGGGSRWNEMARIWVRQGHNITVLAGTVHYMQSSGDQSCLFSLRFNRYGVRVIRCYSSDQHRRSFAGRLWGYLSFALTATIGGWWYANDKYDWVIATSPPLLVGLPALFLSRIKKCPLLVEVRDLWPESAIETGILKSQFLTKLAYKFERILYQKSTLINVLTPAFRDALIRKGVQSEKIIVITNAADFSIAEKPCPMKFTKQFRSELGIENHFLVIYVGAHGIANHLIQVIEAADLLQNEPVHFLLIGDGMQKGALIHAARKRGLTNITFINPLPKSEVFKYILAADAGLSVLKKAEVFKTVYSNKTFDYFSCKRPVLVAIDGISRKLIEDAGAGLFVEPENPEDLAAKVCMYLNDNTLAKSHGENGYHYAKQHFNREQLAREFLSILENMHASRIAKSGS